MVDGRHALEIDFVEPIVLKENDGGRQCVGVEVVPVIAHHAAKVSDDLWREDVPVGDNPHGFEIVRILLLARRSFSHARWIAPGLLNKLVGKLVTR